MAGRKMGNAEVVEGYVIAGLRIEGNLRTFDGIAVVVERIVAGAKIQVQRVAATPTLNRATVRIKGFLGLAQSLVRHPQERPYITVVFGCQQRFEHPGGRVVTAKLKMARGQVVHHVRVSGSGKGNGLLMCRACLGKQAAAVE